MRVPLRPAVIALGLLALPVGLCAVPSGQAFAQAKQQTAPAPTPPSSQAQPEQPPPFRQMALTDKQIEAVLASQKDMDAITDKLPENAAPDQKVLAGLDEVAKKYGFASYDEYNVVIDNISLVLGGVDPATKKYVGSEAVIKSQIAQVQADKKMKPEEKKQALENLNMALKAKEPPVENKGNIDLVLKYYDKLAAALTDDTD